MTENNSFDPKWPETYFLPWSTWFDPYWPGELGFDQKWRFWPENGLKLIFYPGRHGLTRIDSVDSVLTENDGFDPKRLETHFLLWSTCFDPYWLGGLGFDRKWRFWPENSFFTWPTWFDLYWPGGIGSYGKMRLTREKYIFEFSFFLIFLDFYK
jgi:hypothetical protein